MLSILIRFTMRCAAPTSRYKRWKGEAARLWAGRTIIMQNRIPKPAAPCPALSDGIRALAQIAAQTYGNRMQVQYSDCEGCYHSTDSFAVLLQNAHLSQPKDRAAALLRQVEIPEDGVKTALLMLSALLDRGIQAGLRPEDWTRLDGLLAYCEGYLPRIARANSGSLPGGGLTWMTLVAPVRKYARDNGCGATASVLIHALTQPLLTLAETGDADGYEVYERVKALAPNQFFSLHQVGIERSIRTDSPYTDILRMGFDPADGKIKDLSLEPHCLALALGAQTLAFVRRALSNVLQIAAAV